MVPCPCVVCPSLYLPLCFVKARLNLTTRYCKHLEIFFKYEHQQTNWGPSRAPGSRYSSQTIMALNRDLLIALFSTVDMEKKGLNPSLVMRVREQSETKPIWKSMITEGVSLSSPQSKPKDRNGDENRLFGGSSGFPSSSTCRQLSWQSFCSLSGLWSFPVIFLFLLPQQKRTLGWLLSAAMGSTAGWLFDEMGFCCIQTAVPLF